MNLVPTMNAQQEISLPNGAVIEIDNTQFLPILFRGDQLTVDRMRGTQALRDMQDKPIDRFQGVIPVVEDWHARMALMKVWSLINSCIIYLYNSLPLHNRLSGPHKEVRDTYTNNTGPYLQDHTKWSGIHVHIQHNSDEPDFVWSCEAGFMFFVLYVLDILYSSFQGKRGE